MDTAENKILLKYWKASSSQHLYLFDTQTDKLTPIDEKGNSRKAFLAGERIFWTAEGNDTCGKKAVRSLNESKKRRFEAAEPAGKSLEY